MATTEPQVLATDVAAPAGAAPSPNALVSVRALDAFFGATRAVRDVNLDFLEDR